MRVLIIGGTKFLGRHMVEAALAGGHEVTMFNRGVTAPELYPQVEKLTGDRDGGLDALRGRDWEVVIDTCGYVPRLVGQSAALLKDHVGHYTFVSSISVYASHDTGLESQPLIELEDLTVEDVMPYYGGLKVLCERVVEENFPGRALHVRAGFIVGPYDQNKRMAYWLRRIPEGGDVLAPGSPDHPVQIIDARDIADWVLRMGAQGRGGVYNVTGPAHRFGDFLNTIRSASGSDAQWTWVDDAFLLAQEIAPVDGMIYWVPRAYETLMRYNIDHAQAAGFTTRPLEDTLSTCLNWFQTLPADHFEKISSRPDIGQGISREREAELLRLWRDFENNTETQ